MNDCTIVIEGHGSIKITKGTLLSETAVLAGVSIAQPCGGQGRCGRCAVRVLNENVHRRSTLRLSAEDVRAGYALACQTTILGDTEFVVPDQETLARTLTTDRMVTEVQVPLGYDPRRDQSIQRFALTLPPPSLEDQRDDWSRLQTCLRQTIATQQQSRIDHINIPVSLLCEIGSILRENDWQVTAVLQIDTQQSARLLDILPGHVADDTLLLGLAIDIGTTTVSVWLVDLISGEVLAQAAEYNRQIRCGEDVISRVMFASKNKGQDELRTLVLQSINTLIERVIQKTSSKWQVASGNPRSPQIVKATLVGNTIMCHLLLGIPAESIRLSPFVPAINRIPRMTAQEIGLSIHNEAEVIFLPCVASYVGADISAGAFSSGLDDTSQISLFMDIGTNGEIVLGCRDWMVTCACSAGPAFEGSGVRDGMRATQGAIESVWINGRTFKPTLQVIGNTKPRGFCGSGLISLLAEMFLTNVIDKGGHFNQTGITERIRQGENGVEFVVAWAEETWHGKDIAITHVDINNLIRAKAAVYGGISVLVDSVGLDLGESIEQILIGGAFGKYINVEKGIQIGLLPDAPWDQFKFLGNTAVLGAYYALLSQTAHARIQKVAANMTYIELSADNSFYDAFTSALFLPHTNLNLFPSVIKQFHIAEQQPTQ